jgi:predicted aminopeptidase
MGLPSHRSARLFASGSNVFACLAVALAACASGCMPIRYLTQASAGQGELTKRAVPLERAQTAQHLKPRVRALLGRVPEIKAFGERYGLRATKNYTTYADLDRPEVLWVVSACDPLQFKAKTWRFPVVGSFTYLGWFKRTEADTFAVGLRKDGLDVDVRPSHAYSTLGWFKDPVLSTMISPDEDALGELAEVILHESLHATFYVNGQSTLNESVAKFVGDGLALTYLAETQGQDSFERVRYLDAQAEDESRGRAMRDAYEKLDALYKSKAPTPEKLETKRRVLAELRIRGQFRRAPNNATLIQYKTYGSGHAEQAALLAACGGSWQRFLRTLEASLTHFESQKEHEEPDVLLAPVVARGCTAEGR